MKQINSLINTVVLIVLLGVGGIAWASYKWPQFGELTQNLLKQQLDVQGDRVVSIDQIRQVAELVSAIGTYDTIVPVEQNTEVLGWEVGSTTLIFIAHAEIRAGFNLQNLTNANMVQEENRLVVKLPTPQILSIAPDWQKSKVFDYKRSNFLAPDTAPDLIQAAQGKALEKFKQTACEGDLLDRATEQAKRSIPLLMFGYGSIVEVQVEPWNTAACLQD